MPDYNLVFLIFLASFLLLASVGFILVLLSSQKDRAAKREKYLRFYPDENGNYEQAILPDGAFTQFQSGNARWYAPQHYIIQPAKSEVINALPGRPEVRIFTSGKEVEANSQPQLPQTQAEVIAFLVEAKKGGLTKTQALNQLGITGGRSFTKYSKHFDQLP